MIIISLILSYILGSLSSAIIIAKLMGLDDPRLSGSKNAGATNMLRLYGKTHGKLPAILTLLADGLKGLVVIIIAKELGLSLNWQIVSGFVVILGHIYPIFFRFKGGKGVATYLGVLLGFYYPSFIIFALSWLIIAKGFKISALAALCASVITLIGYWLFFNFSVEIKLIISFITVLLFYTHRTNLKQLFK